MDPQPHALDIAEGDIDDLRRRGRPDRFGRSMTGDDDEAPDGTVARLLDAAAYSISDRLIREFGCEAFGLGAPGSEQYRTVDIVRWPGTDPDPRDDGRHIVRDRQEDRSDRATPSRPRRGRTGQHRTQHRQLLPGREGR